MLRRSLMAGVAGTTLLLLAGCASKPLFGPMPEGKNALLKRFKAAANREMARLDLAYKNIDSMYQVMDNSKRRLQIVEDDLKRLEEHHERLRKVMEQADAVRPQIESEELKAAFEKYVAALKAVADAPAGELTDDRIAAWQEAAAEMEPLVD